MVIISFLSDLSFLTLTEDLKLMKPRLYANKTSSKLEYNFITSYVGVDGEYAYSLTVEKVKEFDDGKQLHLL